MSLFSQTGSAVASAKSTHVTAPNTEKDAGVILHISPNSVFRAAGSVPIVANLSEKKIKDTSNLELSAEEEDKFYKKVFRTSLI